MAVEDQRAQIHPKFLGSRMVAQPLEGGRRRSHQLQSGGEPPLEDERLGEVGGEASDFQVLRAAVEVLNGLPEGAARRSR